ncbi:MAG: AAA family ATPase [Planctomycetaceae bacterium]|nr:MAG: AAA family ATPase [Planctomycetaceae bacterium]
MDRVTATTMTLGDIGGLHDEARRVREVVELSLRQPQVAKKLGVSIPKGILLYGPQGTGKTLIAKILAHEIGLDMFTIKWSHVMAMNDEVSMNMLMDIFTKAREHAPSLLLIDDMESMGYDQSPITDLVRKKSAQLIYALDSLNDDDRVVVIGITDKIGTIDPNLKKHRRLGARIEFRVPDEAGRKSILEIQTRGMPLENVNLDYVAKVSVGFMGTDIAALCREATLCALRRHVPESGLAHEIPEATLSGIHVSEPDFQAALRIIGKK